MPLDEPTWSGACWGCREVAQTTGLDVISVLQVRDIARKSKFEICTDRWQTPKGSSGGVSFVLYVPPDRYDAALHAIFKNEELNRLLLAGAMAGEWNHWFRAPANTKIFHGQPSEAAFGKALGEEGVPALRKFVLSNAFKKRGRAFKPQDWWVCYRQVPGFSTPGVDITILMNRYIERFQVLPKGDVIECGKLNIGLLDP